MCEPRLVTRVDQLVRCGEPGRPALTFKSETVTYGELAAKVTEAAHGLHKLGVRRGDRVAIYAEKRIETVVAILATAAAGAVFVPVNPLFKVRQLESLVADCAPRVVITTTQRLGTVHSALTGLAAETPVPRLVVIGAAADEHVLSWDELVVPGAGTQVPGAAAVIDTDLAAILYTSGSTGGPKGVVLSHRNVLMGAASVAQYLGHTADDVVLAALPISFDAGLSQLTTALVAGAHVVLMNYLLPREVPKLCAQHGVTALTCVPPLWIQLAALEWPAEATAQLRYFANTGGRMPRATLDKLRSKLGDAKPFLMYGLTEAFRSTYLDPAEAERRPDSIGKAIPNAEIMVVRPDGTACEPGEHGELVHRGALVAQGYWNDPKRTAERFRPAPGQFGRTVPEMAVWSGDTVYRDEEGFLYFVGRVDDMIKTSGYRVSPTEIEEAAYATGLAGEAAAFGVGDEQRGQHVVLVVAPLSQVAPEDADAFADKLCAAMADEVPKYMIPQRVHVLERLPRSVNGKFDRPQLRRTVVS